MGRYDLDAGEKSNQLIIIAGFAVVIIVALVIWLLGRDEVTDQTQVNTPIALPEAPPDIELPLSVGGADDAQESPHPGAYMNEPVSDEGVEIEEVISEQDIPELPSLSESDPLFKEDMEAVSKGLSPWLNTTDIIRKLLVVLNDFSQGMRIYKHMKFFTLNEPFKVDRDRHGLYMDPAGYRRYDGLVKAIQDIDVQVAIAVYNRYRPLFNEVFSEFGYPESYQLEDLFRKSAAEILEAPVIEDRISLYRPSVRYKFSSPKLENLTPVQKQMIRMGPENTRKIQEKVRILIEALVNRPDSEGVTLG